MRGGFETTGRPHAAKQRVLSSQLIILQDTARPVRKEHVAACTFSQLLIHDAASMTHPPDLGIFALQKTKEGSLCAIYLYGYQARPACKSKTARRTTRRRLYMLEMATTSTLHQAVAYLLAVMLVCLAPVTPASSGVGRNFSLGSPSSQVHVT